ncbi:hypothetical protein SSEA_SKINNY_153 [Mycobacterium phage Skinny]|uniref:Uncharacterized protein n=6 Tax=Bongovirus bongo TaxID=1983750 RepID=A0A0M5M0U2_9CAUD|nr:hypothetical protein PEGLEG_150 [Mycobacterium phage PegLeg]YP_009604981.1 hypothetical protein FDH95_gp100 [Mycobacterium phage Bongo]ALF00658.1 hypothetical protein SEA_BRICOLE_152 [Mycobacterium phage Bricole]AXQ52769.1 hypothetical protein SEA_IPHANE7_147 [Mycobacterium phage IPhane7]QDH93702.1 hypothetical protein SEA_LILHOMIEP_146 [Mycobacterium phage LilhomieP]QGJ93271.1 hypothetical protein SEA_TYDAWG_143 [Mycobacterium phage TyDawg]QUU29330.1 hypothetical protein [Mycobacterium ph
MSYVIEAYQGRGVEPGAEVFAYRNLHRDKWSLVARTGENKGRVVAHATGAVILDARFVVRESGRQKVIRTRRKSVHAGVIGTLVDINDPRVTGILPNTQARYNPYQAGTFTLGYTGAPVYDAPLVDLAPDGKAYI